MNIDDVKYEVHDTGYGNELGLLMPGGYWVRMHCAVVVTSRGGRHE